MDGSDDLMKSGSQSIMIQNILTSEEEDVVLSIIKAY
jgi:hypothetical protein